MSEIEDAHREPLLCDDFQTGAHLLQVVDTTFRMCVGWELIDNFPNKELNPCM